MNTVEVPSLLISVFAWYGSRATSSVPHNPNTQPWHITLIVDVKVFSYIVAVEPADTPAGQSNAITSQVGTAAQAWVKVIEVASRVMVVDINSVSASGALDQSLQP